MTKIEEVARAICPAFYGTDWDVTSDFRRDICLRLARAAIEAMREPTEDMVLAGYGTDDHVQGHDCRAIWRLMTDAALAEPPK